MEGIWCFLIYEGIARREPSLKIRMALQQVGMLVLLAFMVFVNLQRSNQALNQPLSQEMAQLVSNGPLPEHIAIIMDGNGRWAKKRGRTRVHGHKNGVHAVRDVTEACAELGIPNLTLYTFSTENWSRPLTEGECFDAITYQSTQKRDGNLPR